MSDRETKMKEQFTPKKFSEGNAALIEKANVILAEYRAQGYRLSLRQLYYQMVSRDMIPNNPKEYKHLGEVVSDARLAGLIDWDMIEDRGRDYTAPQHWDAPEDIIHAAWASYRIDKWANQPLHVEVMVEKDALSGVLEPVAHGLDIGFTANKGYSSSSALYEASKRILGKVRGGKDIVVLYFGDHDPSGIDMTRDIRDRLDLFTRGRVNLDVKRLALNMDQVLQYGPPENPAKLTDSRADGYIAEFGYSSWELDALRPEVLAALVSDTVTGLRDPALWEEMLAKEAGERAGLEKIYRSYEDVVAWLDEKDNPD